MIRLRLVTFVFLFFHTQVLTLTFSPQSGSTSALPLIASAVNTSAKGSIAGTGVPAGPVTGGVPWQGILDSSRATDWRHSGIPGGIPHIREVCEIVPPSGVIQWQPAKAYAAGDEISDRNGNLQKVTTGGQSGTTAPPWSTSRNKPTTPDNTVTWTLQSTTEGTDTLNIKKAAADCAGQNKVIQLAAGTYVPTNGVVLEGASHLVLRGAGPNQTRFLFPNRGPCREAAYVCISSAIGGRYSGFSARYPCAADWTGGYEHDSTVLTVSNIKGTQPSGGACQFSSTPGTMGNVIFMDQREDGIGICPVSGGVGNCSGVSGATAKGTAVTIVTSLPHGFSVGQKVGVGEVAGTDCPSTNVLAGTNYTSCYNSQTNTVSASMNSAAECDGLQVGCKWWTITAVGCMASGVFTSQENCGTHPITAFQYIAIHAPSGPSGGGYAGVDNGGIFIFGSRDTAIYALPMYARLCGGATSANKVDPPGDASCAVGEISRKEFLETHQVTKVIDATHIQIDPPVINTNFRAGNSPGIWWTYKIMNVGVEDVTFDATPDFATAGGSIIMMTDCIECWVKNVRTITGGRNHIWLQSSLHSQIQDNYMWGTKHGQSTSYGIELSPNDSSNLIVNNICQHVVSCIMPIGDYGDVIAYNYMTDSGYYPADFILGLPGNHSFSAFNLFEGNDAPSIGFDNNHGQGVQATVFRNRFRGVDFPGRDNPGTQIAVGLYAGQRGENFIGNSLGWPGRNTNYESQGRPPRGPSATVWFLGSGHTFPPDDPLVSKSLLRWGNYDTATSASRWCGTGVEANCNKSEIPIQSLPFVNSNQVPANHNLPASFFYSNPPSFWTTTWGTPGWPAIGPDVTATGPLNATCTPSDLNFPYPCDGTGNHSYQIPAQICFDNTPVDPAYQETFSVSDARWTGTPYGGTVVLKLNGLGRIRVASTLDITGITPPGYNGLYVAQAVCGNTKIGSSAAECTVPPTVTYYLANGSKNPGPYISGGTVASPDMRLYNAKNCYPNEYPSPPRFLRRSE